MKRIEIINYVGAFFLGFSLCGIYGFIDGLLLSVAIICFYTVLRADIRRVI